MRDKRLSANDSRKGRHDIGAASVLVQYWSASKIADAGFNSGARKQDPKWMCRGWYWRAIGRREWIGPFTGSKSAYDDAWRTINGEDDDEV